MDNSTPQTPANAKKVLCIEDEHFISELYVRALTKAGYEVKVVLDGEGGLNEALSNDYDIILLDIMLPGMNGIEVLQRIHASLDGNLLKAKIVITTNLDQEEAARQAIERQADGYLIKAEITPKQLVEFLQSM
jgi:DNA-binding response OmpR family regulator